MTALKMSENKTKLKRRNSLPLRKGELDLLVEEMVAMVAGKYSKTILMMANFRTPLVALEEESYQALVVVQAIKIKIKIMAKNRLQTTILTDVMTKMLVGVIEEEASVEEIVEAQEEEIRGIQVEVSEEASVEVDEEAQEEEIRWIQVEVSKKALVEVDEEALEEVIVVDSNKMMVAHMVVVQATMPTKAISIKTVVLIHIHPPIISVATHPPIFSDLTQPKT